MYPSPSINPTKKAKKDEGIEIYSCLSDFKVLLPFFKALLCITPIVGKDISLFDRRIATEKNITAKKHKLIIIVIFFDSTISCPIHGTALIKFVITVAPHSDICPYGKT